MLSDGGGFDCECSSRALIDSFKPVPETYIIVPSMAYDEAMHRENVSCQGCLTVIRPIREAQSRLNEGRKLGGRLSGWRCVKPSRQPSPVEVVFRRSREGRAGVAARQ